MENNIGKAGNNSTELKDTFKRPEDLPTNEVTARQWQQENKSFWEKNSMRYDWKEPIPYPQFSKEYYTEIDRRFLEAVYAVMPWKEIPFEQWLDPLTLSQMDVLEIGVGNGTHAQIISSKAKSYTGIDLTEYAVNSTKIRLDLAGQKGLIRQMDAEKLDFPSASFDFVWSWGVIHHSSNTSKILDEIYRVLKPGGKTVIMVYYRSWWSYYLGGLLIGVFKGAFLKGKTLHEVNQSRTDGALARYYTFSTWRELVGKRFEIKKLETLGNKGDIYPIPGSGLKNILLKATPIWLTIFSLKRARMGSFLICEMNKK